MAIRFQHATKLYVILTLLTIHLCNGLAISQSLNTIVIDPGHGGKDHGCTGDHSTEKHLTLDLAFKVKKVLEENLPNLQIHLTRTQDIFVPLEERCAYANKLNAGLFISLHCNQIDIQSVNGFETYVLGENADKAILQTLQREQSTYTRDEGNTYDGNLDYIIAKSLQHQNLNESILIASMVMDAFDKHTELKRRKIKQANFRVLNGLYMPGILVETGFLSNKKDEAYLKSNAGQDAIATAMTTAIALYEKDQYNSTPNQPLVHNVYSKPLQEVTDKEVTPQGVTPQEAPKEIGVQPLINYGILIAKTVNTQANTNRSEWSQLSDYRIYQQDESYHYIVGDYTLKSTAMKKLVELREVGFKGASIIPLDLIKSYDKVN